MTKFEARRAKSIFCFVAKMGSEKMTWKLQLEHRVPLRGIY